MSRRTVAFEVPVDSSLFTPLQLQPRAAFWLAMSGWAHWLRTHWTPFPRLIREHRTGVVICSLDLEYTRPFGFFDADALVATVGLEARTDGALLFLTLTIAPADGEEFARVTAVLRPVRIADATVLGAAPASLDPVALAVFEPGELRAGWPGRRLQANAAMLATDHEPLATGSLRQPIHRGLCETADQWSAIALPDLAGAAREHLVTSSNGDPVLATGLTAPVRRIGLEFHRPGFFLDEVDVECRAYAPPGEAVFVHQVGPAGGGARLATFIEWFAQQEVTP